VHEQLAARIAAGSAVVIVGERAAAAAESLRAGGCDVTTVGDPACVADAAPFDAAVVAEFDERWGQPSEFLRGLRPSLRSDGRVLVSRRDAGAAAMRVGLYGESVGEAVAPTVRPVDLERFAASALEGLLRTAGYRVVAGAPGDAWIEGIPAPEPARGEATPPLDPLALAHAEVRELRAFTATVLERQRRLHEELARLRASLARRDESLAALRDELAELAGVRAVALERERQLTVAEGRFAEAEGRILDLEARRQRLTEAIAELRERNSGP
jgi:hypothetical protein